MFQSSIHISVILLSSFHLISPQRRNYYSYQERIFTDLDTIRSPYGVPRDFSYTEKAESTDQLISVPGCPKSIEGFPWLLYMPNAMSQATQPNEFRCYLAGFRGPCPEGQVLFAQSGSPFGVCSCECLLNPDKTHMSSPQLSNDNRLKLCAGGLQYQVYEKRDKRICYNINQQGPCFPGTILALVKPKVGGDTFNALKCLPLCSVDDNNFREKAENGECVGSIVGGAASTAQPHECTRNEKFSRVLKACVRRFRNTALILG